ncbi:hypothetical protein EYF80_048775 [Liparis tanakae]|uniref:Uncharacterized protein n=1 Tax=Liparis tanakae TaxID=230148 RepID=A0A4Z2FJV2_9TELE|nr:hypothetical protein EYF80_048775 [Liparis tanakae]
MSPTSTELRFHFPSPSPPFPIPHSPHVSPHSPPSSPLLAPGDPSGSSGPARKSNPFSASSVSGSSLRSEVVEDGVDDGFFLTIWGTPQDTRKSFKNGE